MVVLDTDHMSLLEWADVRDSTPLRTRLAALPPAEVVTTIISYEEQLRGWMTYIARTRAMNKATVVLTMTHNHANTLC
jgi:tRNA(fMet)-specific endonuclease VapC